MPARDRSHYYPTTQAAGSQRLYQAEAEEGTIATLTAAAPQVWTNPRELTPGLWVVRVISGYQTGCQVMVARREDITNPGTGALPAAVTGLQRPRVCLFDPLYSAVAEAAGRASVIELDIDHRGGQLWAQAIGNDDCQILITLVAARAGGWGGGDVES